MLFALWLYVCLNTVYIVGAFAQQPLQAPQVPSTQAHSGTWREWILTAAQLQHRRLVEEALQWSDRALAAATGLGESAEAIEVIQLRRSLILTDLGRSLEAKKIVEQIVHARTAREGAGTVATATALHHLGFILQVRGETAEALPSIRQSIRVLERDLGAAHDHTLSAKSNFAEALIAQGEPQRAESLLRGVIALTEPASPDIIPRRNQLAIALCAQGRTEEALAEIELALSRSRAFSDSGISRIENVLNTAGQIAVMRKDFKRAVRYLEEARDFAIIHLPPGHPNWHAILAPLGYAHFMLGQKELAEREIRQAYDLARQSLIARHPEIDTTARLLALVLKSRGAKREAKEILAAVPKPLPGQTASDGRVISASSLRSGR